MEGILSRGQGNRNLIVYNSRETVEVEYQLTDESFDHAFGKRKLTGFSIYKIRIYVDEMEEWIDVTHANNKKINELAFEIVDSQF